MLSTACPAKREPMSIFKRSCTRSPPALVELRAAEPRGGRALLAGGRTSLLLRVHFQRQLAGNRRTKPRAIETAGGRREQQRLLYSSSRTRKPKRLDAPKMR